MGRYGTREEEVDQLLRGASSSTSIASSASRSALRSRATPSRRWRRSTGSCARSTCATPGSSIVAFEQWLELGEGERPEATHLERIERYNRDDVVSTQRLRDWLEARRDELASLAGVPVPGPSPRDAAVPPELTEAQARVQALADRLAGPDVVPTDPTDRDPDQQARWLLGQLLGWHRREDKAMWWAFHHQMDLTPEQLVEESDPVGLLEVIGPIDEERKGKQTWRYRFPPQDLDLGRLRTAVYDPARKQADPDASPFTWDAGELIAVDVAERTIDLRRSLEDPHPRALVPLPWIRTPDQQARLFELGEWVVEHGLDGPGPAPAARALLLGRPPTLGQSAWRCPAAAG